MKRHVMMSLIVGSVVACVSIVMAKTDESNKSSAPKNSWKITAELEEACSCNGPCPCWFNALPSRMTCSGSQVVFIQKGRHGKLSLDGLALGQFVKSPEGQTMADSLGKWYFDYVYIDER